MRKKIYFQMQHGDKRLTLKPFSRRERSKQKILNMTNEDNELQL